MEIKVQCDCGQKFKFDVEPVNGRMPFVVNCPVCGADGTARANVLLQQLLPPAPIAAAFTPAPAPVSAPAPTPMRPAGLSINRPQAPPATPDPAEETEADDDSEAETVGGVREVKLGWKMWGLIILFIGLIAGTSYLKSARRTFVGDVLDWGWEKITGTRGGGDSSAGGNEATDYKALDKDAEEEIKADNAAEAREWLANSANAIFEGDRAEVVALMEDFYKAGCPKVYMTGIEKLGGTSVSASMVAVLPSDATQRLSAFKVENEFSKKHGESGDPDKGQKYIWLSFD